jgi:hypothetical protein
MSAHPARTGAERLATTPGRRSNASSGAIGVRDLMELCCRAVSVPGRSRVKEIDDGSDVAGLVGNRPSPNGLERVMQQRITGEVSAFGEPAFHPDTGERRARMACC